MNLIVDDEFKGLLAPLDKEELAGLEAMIVAKGVLTPILVWETSEGKRIVIDGHNRYAIADKHGIGFETKAIRFASREEAKQWIRHHQANRRNVSKGEAAILRGERAIAQRMSRGENLKKPNENKVGQNGPSMAAAKKPIAEIAKEEGVSPRQIKRDIAKVEVRDEAKKVDEATAAAVVSLPDSAVAEIKKATKSVPPETKPEAVAAEVKKRIATPQAEPVKIEGACDELNQMVQSGVITRKVAENLVDEVPGLAAQAKLVASGVDAVKRAASKPREPKPVTVTESQVIAFIQNADAKTRARVAVKTLKGSTGPERSTIISAQLKALTEKEKLKLVEWTRKQDSGLDQELTAKEITNTARRAKSELNNGRHRVSLVKKLLDSPTPELLKAMRTWAHHHLVGKASLFVPPTREQVVEYAATLDRDTYPQATDPRRITHFMDYHESGGWVYGKANTPLKDWKARFRDSLGWELSGVEQPDTKTPEEIERRKKQDAELAERRRKIKVNQDRLAARRASGELANT
ncbi:MAG: ParB N-terminal domain-containing protein [Planctomycetota bacterium]